MVPDMSGQPPSPACGRRCPAGADEGAFRAMPHVCPHPNPSPAGGRGAMVPGGRRFGDIVRERQQ